MNMCITYKPKDPTYCLVAAHQWSSNTLLLDTCKEKLSRRLPGEERGIQLGWLKPKPHNKEAVYSLLLAWSSNNLCEKPILETHLQPGRSAACEALEHGSRLGLKVHDVRYLPPAFRRTDRAWEDCALR